MNATAAVPAQNFHEEIANLQAEISELAGKRTLEQKVLAALETERGRNSEGIARGTAKPSQASELARKIEQSRAAIEGLGTLIAETQRRYDAAFAEQQKQETEARRAAEMAEIPNLKSEGAAILARIAETLKSTLGADLARYAAIRARFNKIMDDTAKRGGFPIPPAAFAARKAKNELGEQLAALLAPIQKMIR